MITKNIYDLEAKSHIVFTEYGYSKSSIESILSMVRKVIIFHAERGEEHWNNDIVADYINDQRNRYQNGEISKSTFLGRRKASEYLKQIHDTGTITIAKHNHLTELPKYFENILTDILANESCNLNFRKSQCVSNRVFFRWLYDNGHVDLSRVDESIICEYFTDCSARMVGRSLEHTRRALKELFIFISEDGLLPEAMHKLFLFRVPADKKIKPFMPQDEIAALLNVIDRNTVQGKRDYAMILLAAVTGFRRIDIAALTFNSIDWRNGEIRIIQEKTETALALPLTTDVGKAIRKYLDARPIS